MIQRIQTLHLLIVTALMAVTLFAPLAWFAGDAGEFRLYAFSLQTSAGEAVQSTVYMGVVLALACVLPFITDLPVQTPPAPRSGLCRRGDRAADRFCGYGKRPIISSVGGFFPNFRSITQGFRPAIALPLVCLLFAYLAARAVFRDELMVRAADRIR